MNIEEILNFNKINKTVILKTDEKTFFFLSRDTWSGIRRVGVYYETCGQSRIVMDLADGVSGRKILKVTVTDEDGTVFDILKLDALYSENHYHLPNLEDICTIYGITMDESNINRFVKVFLKYKDTKYMLLVNPEAVIDNLKAKVFGKSSRSLYFSETVVEESRRIVDYTKSSSFNMDLKDKVRFINLRDVYPPCDMAWNPSTFIKKLAAKIGCDVDGLRFYDQNKTMINEPLKMDKVTAMIESHQSLYYEASNTRVKCISFMKVEECFELNIPVECKAHELITRLQKKLKLNKETMLLFQNNTWLQGDSLLSLSEEVKYHIASLFKDLVNNVALDQGGFGIVYKCRTKTDQAYIALKKLSLSDKETHKVTNLIREFTVMSQLPTHPNIVRFINLYTDQKDIFIAMEYMTEGSLKKYIEEKGAQEEDFVRRISKDLVAGLDHLHKNNILHRDIKSANVLLNKNVAKLSDFGISKNLSNKRSEELSEGMLLTARCGTERWMSPEVISGGAYGMKADVWSLGATVIEMITGNVPHYGVRDAALIVTIGSTKTIKYEAVYEMSQEFRDFLEMCLKPEPNNRPGSRELLNVPFISEP